MARNGLVNWQFQLFNARTGREINDDSGICNVLVNGSPAEETIYSDEILTVASNPLTFTNGKVEFYTIDTVTAVDLSIYTANGDAVFVQGLVLSDHRVEIDVERLDQMLVIPFGISDNSEIDTGFILNGDCLLEDVMIKVTTIDDTETLDVGLNGTTTNDPNGLVAAASVGTLGHVELAPQITGGSNIDYVGTNFIGVLLGTSIAGADAVATVGGFTRLRTLKGAAETDANITYTGSAGSDTAAGYIFLFLKKLP